VAATCRAVPAEDINIHMGVVYKAVVKIRKACKHDTRVWHRFIPKVGDESSTPKLGFWAKLIRWFKNLFK
jgi:hypothetical protein